jgi:cell division protein FtsX
MAGTPLNNPNWATETTDTVVRLVGKVRDNGTTKVVWAARGLVFGVIAAFLGVFALVLVLIGLTRGVQSVFDLFLSRPRAVYASYLLVGGIFCLVGAFCFKKRGASSSAT